MKPKTRKSLSLSSLYHPPTVLQNMFFFRECSQQQLLFSEVLCAVSKINVYIYIRFQELSVILHIVFNNILCDLVLLFRKSSLRPSISLLTNQYVLVFTYRQGRSTKKFFKSHFIFSVVLMLLFVSLCISHVPAIFNIKRVLTNFAIFIENT